MVFDFMDVDVQSWENCSDKMSYSLFLRIVIMCNIFLL